MKIIKKQFPTETHFHIIENGEITGVLAAQNDIEGEVEKAEERANLIANASGLSEYQSREYCRDINCGMQKLIDNDTELGKNFAKSFCRKECEAYKFHKWLQENNYTIIKED